MPTRLIYRRPVAGTSLKPILGEYTDAELRGVVGDDVARRLMAGEPVAIENYTAVDLVAFYEACCQDADLLGLRLTEGAPI